MQCRKHGGGRAGAFGALKAGTRAARKNLTRRAGLSRTATRVAAADARTTHDLDFSWSGIAQRSSLWDGRTRESRPPYLNLDSRKIKRPKERKEGMMRSSSSTATPVAFLQSLSSERQRKKREMLLAAFRLPRPPLISSARHRQ